MMHSDGHVFAVMCCCSWLLGFASLHSRMQLASSQYCWCYQADLHPVVMLNNVTGNGIELAADPPYKLNSPSAALSHTSKVERWFDRRKQVNIFWCYVLQADPHKLVADDWGYHLTYLISYLSWVLATIMTESSPCFQKCDKGSRCRFWKMVCPGCELIVYLSTRTVRADEVCA